MTLIYQLLMREDITNRVNEFVQMVRIVSVANQSMDVLVINSFFLSFLHTCNLSIHQYNYCL